MDVVTAVCADGLIQILFLQIQVENIHHEMKIGSSHPVHHGRSLCQGIDEVGLHDGHCLQGNVHLFRGRIVSQLSKRTLSQSARFLPVQFPAVLSPYPPYIYIGPQVTGKINDFLCPLHGLPA